jgi:phosphatidylserine/phosphatidylglycerophosphate/cardiolipin synthase-like enzyme
MGLVAWIKSILPIRKRDNDEISIYAFRKEIEKLKRENKELNEKILVISNRDNEKIPIQFVDENIEASIIKNIREAKEEICIASAWLTSKVLISELENLKRQGINIKIIITKSKYNNESKLMSVCSSLKVVVMPKVAKYEKYDNDGEPRNHMHHKYCIIDNKKVIDGSYNWSKNAQNNLEHIIIIESSYVAKMFMNNFNGIYNNPIYYSDYRVYDRLG